jgi:hypothetical protein
LANIGGALGVDRLVTIKVARIGEDWVLACKVINIRTAQVEARSSEFVRGDIKGLIQAMPGTAKRLFQGGGTAAISPATGTAAAPAKPATPVAPVTPPPAAPGAPQKNGSLLITTVPVGANCRLNGKDLAFSPCLANDLAPGNYEVELSKQFYRPKKVTVYAYPGVETKVSYSLEPEPVEVVVQATPPDATILVNDDPAASPTLRLLPGTYHLALERDDFEDVTQSLTVNPGPVQKVTLQMVPGYSGSQRSSRTQRLVWGLIFAGVAGGTGAVWGWQGSEAQSAYDRMKKASPSDQAAIDRIVSSGNTSKTVADVFMISTCVTGAVAISLLTSLLF